MHIALLLRVMQSAGEYGIGSDLKGNSPQLVDMLQKIDHTAPLIGGDVPCANWRRATLVSQQSQSHSWLAYTLPGTING